MSTLCVITAFVCGILATIATFWWLGTRALKRRGKVIPGLNSIQTTAENVVTVIKSEGE